MKTTGFSLLRRALRPVRGRLLLAAALGALATLSSVSLTATAAWLIARAAEHPPVLTLMVAAVAVRTFGVSRAVLRYLERLASHDAALRVMARWRVDVFSALVPQSPTGLRAARRGDLLSRLVRDVEVVEDVAVRVAVPIVASLIASAAVVSFMFVVLPGAGVVVLVALVLGGVGVPLTVVRADRRASARTATAKAELATAVVDLVDGAAELAVYGGTTAALRMIDERDRRTAALERRAAFGAALGGAIGAIVAGAALFAATVVGMSAVSAGSLGGVAYVVVVLTAWAAPDVIADLPGVGQQLARAGSAAGRLAEILDAVAPVAEPADAVGFARPSHPPLVTLSGVVARYPGGAQPVLDGVDLVVRPGSRIFVVGESGAGKSTLLSTMLRFVEVERGRITIDGRDVATMPTGDVRAVIGCCEQQPHLFDSTIRANLLLADPSADDAALLGALTRVGLGDWLAGLPAGLDTRVGENGAEVSGGQLRRIALARIVLSRHPVVLFDEPTEGLDEAAAGALMSDVLAATADRSVVIVTHRLSDVTADDAVLRLRDGRLEDIGRHRTSERLRHSA
jgi:thiol reductant ABC exporter CydC subunit